MIRPPFGERAKAVMPRSISSASRTPTGVGSIPSDGATVWIAANPPEPAGTEGSRMTATRVTRGAISLSSSTHFPLRLNSDEVKPVALPPGRAKRTLDIARGPAVVDAHIAADGPSRLLQALRKRCDAHSPVRIVLRLPHQRADAPHPLGLLRAR